MSFSTPSQNIEPLFFRFSRQLITFPNSKIYYSPVSHFSRIIFITYVLIIIACTIHIRGQHEHQLSSLIPVSILAQFPYSSSVSQLFLCPLPCMPPSVSRSTTSSIPSYPLPSSHIITVQSTDIYLFVPQFLFFLCVPCYGRFPLIISSSVPALLQCTYPVEDVAVQPFTTSISFSSYSVSRCRCSEHISDAFHLSLSWLSLPLFTYLCRGFP